MTSRGYSFITWVGSGISRSSARSWLSQRGVQPVDRFLLPAPPKTQAKPKSRASREDPKIVPQDEGMTLGGSDGRNVVRLCTPKPSKLRV